MRALACSLAASLLLTGCLAGMLPVDPVVAPEALPGESAPSGRDYAGAAAVVPFPVLPFRLWGLDFEEEALWEFADDETYGMVELARVRKRDGSRTWFALVSEKTGRQHVAVRTPEDLVLARAFPAPSYDGRLRVVRLAAEKHLEHVAALDLPDGRLAQAFVTGPRRAAAPPKRNGHAMNHSQEQVLATLDLRELGLARASVYVDDRWAPVRMLVPFVPYAMRLVQTAGGIGAGGLTLTPGEDGVAVQSAIDGADSPMKFRWVERGGLLELVGEDPIVDHVYRFRATTDRGAEGPIELVEAEICHPAADDQSSLPADDPGRGGCPEGSVSAVRLRFHPALPDLRRPLDREYLSRLYAGSFGREGYMTGEVRVRPAKDGLTEVDVLPSAPNWACRRPVRSRLELSAGRVRLEGTVRPDLAVDGLGADSCE